MLFMSKCIYVETEFEKINSFIHSFMLGATVKKISHILYAYEKKTQKNIYFIII